MAEKYEKWEEEAKKREQKSLELEKRLLAFKEQFESGNLTEEEYQMHINQEKDFMEPTANWEPIEEIEPVESLETIEEIEINDDPSQTQNKK